MPVPIAAEGGEATDHLFDLISDQVVRGLVFKLIDHGARPPVVGFELLVGNAVAGMAELAWPEAKIAVLLESQAEDRPVFESAGWRILPLDFDILNQSLSNQS
jgi:hypothetical protein